jgi:hypothetical protein
MVADGPLSAARLSPSGVRPPMRRILVLADSSKKPLCFRKVLFTA